MIGGPDVWEIVMWIDELGPVDDPAAELTTELAIPRPRVDAALAYYAAYPGEIKTLIKLHHENTAIAGSR